MAPKDSNTTKGSSPQIKETRVISKKLSVDELLNSRGASGTYIVNGFLESDYNSKLAGEAGLEVYDEMRKADSQVRASLMVCMLPLLSTEWYFDAAKDEETDEVGEVEQEVADFCSKAMFEKMDISWTSHLTEVLTLLPFGFSIFEKTYTADDDDDHIWIKSLGYRRQKTIVKWEMEDGAAGITQQLPSQIVELDHPNVGETKVSIPSSKLLLFSYQREGENYQGVSVLRSAYKHWYIKDALYKFDAIRHERQGVGIPVIELPMKSTTKDREEAKAILRNIRANEQGGVVLPNPNWKFYFADLQAGNVSDIWKSIDHHNREIAKNVLAQFLELGNTESGSRALSEDQSDFFLLALEALANMIEDVYNRHLIPELVDLNYEVKDYPKLRHRKLGSVDYSTISTVLSTAVSAGIMEPDEDLEEWFRDMIDAPKKVILEEDDMDDMEEEIDPITGMPVDPNIEPEIDPETGLPIDPAIDPAIDPETGLPIEASEFRIVSEETKKKISDSLKKANAGKGKGNAIAQRRAQRLKKAGVRDTASRRAKNVQSAQDATSGKLPEAKKKKRSKLGTALKKLTAKKPKAKKAKKTGKKLGDALKIASKKKVHAHEASEYGLIFAETARHVLSAQALVPKTAQEPLPPKVFKENTYESWRPLTFAEQKIDFNSINKVVNKFKGALNIEIDTITADQKADLLKQVQRAVEKNDIVSIGTLRAKYTGDLSSALTNVQKEMFEAGKISASTEMNVRVAGTAREVMGALKVGNDKLVQKMTSDMESAASLAVSQTIARKGGSISGTGTAEAVNAASQAIDKVLESKGRLNTLTLMGSLNLGRASVFERYPEKVYGFQYSAIVDDKTTDLCLSLDGRVVAAGSADFYSYGPPQHYECRSLWVEILQEEEFKPDTDDIPSKITANSSIDVFQDLSAPIIAKGSSAVKVLQEEIDWRKAQVDTYQKSGQYQNRIDTHQARIKQLEKSVKGK